ncbi:lichenicidin A2 family type 2 lantibiotic [Staphylococcus intermedius]|uniref:Type 2 lantibiotic, SP_1948 family n=1 Tax=Staphylococcus intermedius NCTC 11048 TaxID=1141106 RepID=A0A380G0I8_STAIN|nr:lichenicidin A2 family type 2 lantibiotic [Staphylococcus intermedius]SUM43748.1 type 2 lantibiotic, SP_1948 family [Staphylococcus intermedius NCTC 11048]
MNELNMEKVVGEAFEDLSIAEMTNIQGSGDMTPESSPVCSAFATLASSIQLVKTIKAKC